MAAIISDRPGAGSDGGAPRTVLCLHGFRTNAHVLRLQTQDMFNHCSGIVPVYVDAPHAARGPAYPAVEMAFPSAKQRGGWREWYNYMPREDGSGGRDCYEGMAESVAFVEAEVARLRPFAICGFSQGAVIAAIVAKNAEANTEKNICGNSDADVASGLTHLLMLCAVPPRQFYANFPEFHAVPMAAYKTLHCIGSRDPMKASSEQFAAKAFDEASSEVLVHSGNHKPPSVFERAETFDRVRDFLNQ